MINGKGNSNASYLTVFILEGIRKGVPAFI